MARQKQATPLRREPSDFESVNGHSIEKKGNGEAINGGASLASKPPSSTPMTAAEQKQAGITQLLICVGGIYASLYDISSF